MKCRNNYLERTITSIYWICYIHKTNFVCLFLCTVLVNNVGGRVNT